MAGSGPIYLDYNATTPIAPEVLEAMLPALRDGWGNPSSSHAYGQAARALIDTARSHVAALIGCEPDEIVFTSGGTESDNAAVLGVAEAQAARGRHIVISAVEHAAVEQPCRRLEQRGYAVSRVGVDGDGRVDPAAVEAALRDDTVLVSLIHGQNETGVVQPVTEVARRTRARGIPFHSDTAQSAGKLPIDVDALGVDLLTLAGHKLYAPKGVGALYVRRGTPFARLLSGAAHESGRRAGTENTAGIVGLGAACALASAEGDRRPAQLRAMRDRLEQGLRRRFPDLVVHGGRVERLPNTLSCAIPGVVAHDLLGAAPGIASAAGQACHAGRPTVSAALEAMGVPDSIALATMRLCVGRGTTPEDIDRAIDEIGRAAERLRGRV